LWFWPEGVVSLLIGLGAGAASFFLLAAMPQIISSMVSLLPILRALHKAIPSLRGRSGHDDKMGDRKATDDASNSILERLERERLKALQEYFEEHSMESDDEDPAKGT
jgi:hypothetical protein